MMQYNNSLALIEDASNENLYDKLLQQLEKDFALANETISLKKTISPQQLVAIITDKIYFLLQHKFNEYLNLLYIIDVSEREIKNITVIDMETIASEVSFLILKREWQKVWYRNRY